MRREGETYERDGAKYMMVEGREVMLVRLELGVGVPWPGTKMDWPDTRGWTTEQVRHWMAEKSQDEQAAKERDRAVFRATVLLLIWPIIAIIDWVRK